MKISEQQQLRAQTADVMLQWAKEREPPFSGDSPDEFKDAITAAHVIADEAKMELHRWVDAGRRTGLSWADIGNTLGISKQAAQQRFKPDQAPEDDAGDETGETIVRLGATAFNEVNILREEGAKGRELVDIGLLKLVFRQSDSTWEHQRLVGAAPLIARMKKDGWTLVSSWLPFHYLKRRIPAD